MKFVLCSYRRGLGNKPEFFQPASLEGLHPGITRRREEAKQFASREEAEMAIPSFQHLKRDQASRIRKHFKQRYGENPFQQADPITIEPVHIAIVFV